jgi:hypothetical protein
MLSELRENGFQVTLDGEDIVVSPSYKLTPEQCELIREHKAEIIAELASRPVTLDLTSEDRRREALAAVKRGDTVRVLSATLEESVYWVLDEEIAERLKREPDYQGEVIYTRAELWDLAGQSPEFLRGIHQFKKTFGATVQKTTKEAHKKLRPIYKGNSEQDKAAVIQDLIDRLTESGRRLEASEQSLKIAGAELVEAREHIDFLKQVNGNLIEHSQELIMQLRELKVSMAIEISKAYTRMWTLRTHNPASGLSEADIRLLLQLCHPDKHNGSAASEKAARLLLGLREARAG